MTNDAAATPRLTGVADTIRLVVEGRTLEVRPGAILGRSRSADVVIRHPLVSRKHAQVHRSSTGWFISDLASSNGVYDADGRSTTLMLGPDKNVFWLGPPNTGCAVEAITPTPLSEAVTKRATRPDPAAATARLPDNRLPVQGEAPRTPLQPFAPSPAPRRAPVLMPASASAQPVSGNGRQQRRSSAGWRASGVSVRAEGLTVIVDNELVILDEATLTIEAGTLTAIVGPSGCGKSTLANLLSGRTSPTKGTVTIGGQPMSGAIRQQIGSVPQYDAVHERLTVRHALTAAARLRLPAGTPSARIDEAVAKTADVLGLADRLNVRVAKLSGGQKKRVSVGYELVADPVMMVLDEPTSGLDPGLEQELIAELRAIADRGTTTLVVTHSPDAAEQADLVVVMAPGGHVAFVGPPDEVLDHFSASTWAEVFNQLTPDYAAQWAAYFRTSPAYHRHVVSPPRLATGSMAPVAAGTTTDRSWSGDFRVMVGRYLRSIVADPKTLVLLAIQAPILGLLFAAVLDTNVFSIGLRPSTAAREFVLAVVLAMAWIGASNSIREIVKERKTFLRERAVGVSAGALVASRWVVLSAITIVQAVVLYFAAVSRQSTPPDQGVLLGRGPLELMAALIVVGLAGVGIGLVISGAVTDAAKSMAVLPIVLIPVILFSGLLIPTSGSFPLQLLSWIDPIQWGSSAAAVTSNVLEKEGCNPTGLQAQLQQVLLGRTISCTNPRWQPTALTQSLNLALGALNIAVLAGLSLVVTTRSTRSLRI